jgi:hypothetical protein
MKKLLGYMMIAIGLGGGLTYVYAFDYFKATAPRSPKPEEGEIYALNNHGTVVFLSNSQRWVLTIIGVAGVAVAAVGGLIIKSLEDKK